QVAHELHEESEVALLLANDDGGRVFAGAGEPGAVGRAVDLDETFGSAAHGADLLTDCGATAARLASAAQRTNHGGHYCILCAEIPGKSQLFIGTRLAALLHERGVWPDNANPPLITPFRTSRSSSRARSRTSVSPRTS